MSVTIDAEQVERATESFDTYEAICDRNRERVGHMDSHRWSIGDDAALVESKYGQHTTEDFARDIGANKSTIAGYRRVSQFYPKSIRRIKLDELQNLTYSHWKDALRLKDLDEAIKWLEQVSDEGWSPDKASHELTEKLGHKTVEPPIPGTIEDVVVQIDGTVLVLILIGKDDLETMKKVIGADVNLKVK